ncbi:MAG: DUF3419 family protein [Pseudomonadota bacterium]
MTDTSTAASAMAQTDIAARAKFDYIRYAQVWEDADILVAALKPKPSDTVVSIASAGDNALALLAEGPKKVIAVDLNPTQLACLRLRVAAYEHLSHTEFLQLMGSRASDRRGELFDKVARHVSEDDQAFWASLKQEVAAHGLGGVGKFERYFRIFRTRILPLVHGRQRIGRLTEPKPPEGRITFYQKEWNSWRWRWMLKAFFSRTVMGRLGRDPAFFDHASGSLSDQVAGLTRRALVDQDPAANPYLRWILKGRHGSTLPRALRGEHFDVIRDNLDRLEIRECTVETLAGEGVKADAFNLSDIFEYMSPSAHEDAYCTVLAAANPGARIAYWNMMAPRRVPDALSDQVVTLQELEDELKPQDKAFFYQDFIVEQVT